jgi:catechol 2,3-dioxygenase-like lactoylglutathione lyase family enzyme
MNSHPGQEREPRARPRLLHIVLLAADPQATAAWYQAVLGAERISTAEGACRLSIGSVELLVQGERADEMPLPASAQPRLGLDHLVLTVADLDALVAAAQRHGARVFDDTDDRVPGRRAVTVVGPEGVRIQLIEDV